MEMLERCPGCSVAREVEPKKAESASHQARPCSHCGYDGPFPPPEAEIAAPRDSLPSFAGARAKLATATQDLFRLSGSHSIPVDTRLSDPPAAPSVPEPSSQGRKKEASMMFSLEALMKANQPAPKRDTNDEASSQLWDMQASTPLFGTAYDEALLTTPLKMEPAQSMDSMTLPSQTPNGRRWWPFVLAATAGLALAGAGIWVFGASNGASAVRAAIPSSEQAALSAETKAPQELAQPLPEPPGAAEPPASDVPGSNPGGRAAGEPAAAASATEPAAGESPPSEATTAKENAPAGAGEGGEPRDNAPSSTKPDGEKAGKDRTIKKPTARVEKPSAPPKLGAAVFAFDKAAAKAALNAAAEAAASCGAGGEPGKGKIQVTFAPTGKVSGADLVEGPFAGTTAGKCALRHFKAAKVPAFSGAPVTVAKSFRVD